MRAFAVILVFGVLSAIGVHAALTCSSKAMAECDQTINQNMTISVCDMSGVTINVTGSVVFGGCTSIINADQSATQLADCYAKAGC